MPARSHAARGAGSKAAAGSKRLSRTNAAASMMDDLMAQIRSKALLPGSLILSGPELTRRYGISYQTVVRGLAELTERGWLVRQQGRGTYVAPHPPLENSESARGRTVLLALDPRSLERGRFGFSIVEALDEALAREGLRLRYAPLSAAGEAALLEELATSSGDVAFAIAFDRPAFLRKVLSRCPVLPALALHDTPEPPQSTGRFDAILVDDQPGGFQAGDLLAARGHKRLGFLGGPRDDARAQRRAAGFREALKKRGLGPPVEVWAAGWDERSGQAAAAGLLKKLAPTGVSGRCEPCAVFCANDRLARGLYDAVAEAKLRVPEDISVVGFDDQEVASSLSPPLTTLRIDRAEYGRQAARLVKERLAQPARTGRCLLLPVTPVERGSVRNLAASGAAGKK